MEEEKEIPCTSIYYSFASSITNYTRAHARTLCTINTHATRLLTVYGSISSKPQNPQCNPTAPKIKERGEGGGGGKRKMQCMSITLLLASSITNYTRVHARTLCIINTHATRLLTN